MNQKTLIALSTSCFLIIVILFGSYLISQNTPRPLNINFSGYFAERIISLSIEDVGQPREGFTPQPIMTAFPGFKNSDFENVRANEGHYKTSGNELRFIPDNETPKTSAAETISEEGYATLLDNLSKRLNIKIDSTTDIDKIIEALDIADYIETRIDQGGSAFGIQVIPLEIIEDSRCPVGVQCIQAGTVRIRTLLKADNKEVERIFELDKPVQTAKTQITLMRVEPETRASDKINLREYRFYFEIKKL